MKRFKWLALVAVLIQLFPFGQTRSNPPETKEPAWDSPKTGN
jgi:hypothetical protein